MTKAQREVFERLVEMGRKLDREIKAKHKLIAELRAQRAEIMRVYEAAYGPFPEECP